MSDLSQGSMIEKISARMKKTSKPAEEKPREVAEKKSCDTRRNFSFDPPAEKPCPCLDCWSPTFWRSLYGGPLRCAACEPWPSLALVGERWTLYMLADDTLAWVPCLQPGEHTRDRVPLEQQLAQEPGLRAYEMEDAEGAWLVIERT